MRYLLGAVALAPFVLLLLAMVTGRARVAPCCPPAVPADPVRRHVPDPRGVRTPARSGTPVARHVRRLRPSGPFRGQ